MEKKDDFFFLSHFTNLILHRVRFPLMVTDNKSIESWELFTRKIIAVGEYWFGKERNWSDNWMRNVLFTRELINSLERSFRKTEDTLSWSMWPRFLYLPAITCFRLGTRGTKNYVISFFLSPYSGRGYDDVWFVFVACYWRRRKPVLEFCVRCLGWSWMSTRGIECTAQFIRRIIFLPTGVIERLGRFRSDWKIGNSQKYTSNKRISLQAVGMIRVQK